MLSTKQELPFWDVRLIEHKMRRGEVTPQEYQTYLDGLEDVSEKATVCTPFAEAHTMSESYPSYEEESPLARNATALDNDEEDLSDDDDFQFEQDEFSDEDEEDEE